jgi:hypothetical protein
METTIMSLSNYPLIVGLLFVSSLVGAAPLATCPQSIKEGSQSYALNDASLFDGPPEELADLMPDRDGEMVWSLPAYQKSAQQRGEALYFVCKYLKSKRTLSLKVSKAATTCSVVIRKGQTIAACE